MSRLRLALGVSLVVLGLVASWKLQAWRYGRMLAEQAEQLVQQRLEQAEMLNGLLLEERAQRVALEQRLHASESKHFQELTDAQTAQARLRDRLATADLRLSVLVERDAGCPAMPATATASGLDDGTVRARLDPAHARRIVAITDDGDRGLIALRACQDYVRALHP